MKKFAQLKFDQLIPQLMIDFFEYMTSINLIGLINGIRIQKGEEKVEFRDMKPISSTVR